MKKQTLNDFVQYVGNLADRWADEKEHEDFADYIAAAKAAAEKQGLEFVKLTKRPFALVVHEAKVGETTFRVNGNKVEVTLKKEDPALTSARQVVEEQAKAKAKAKEETVNPDGEWMAYNHNMTPLMNKPSTKAVANKEAKEYRQATGNASSVGKVEVKAPKAKAEKTKPVAKDKKEPKEKKVTIASVIVENLKKGMTPADVLAEVKKAFKDAKTSIACVYWYSSKIRCGHI